MKNVVRADLKYKYKAIIRESVDSLSRDRARCAENETRQVENSKPFKALHHATEVLLYLLVRLFITNRLLWCTRCAFSQIELSFFSQDILT